MSDEDIDLDALLQSAFEEYENDHQDDNDSNNNSDSSSTINNQHQNLQNNSSQVGEAVNENNMFKDLDLENLNFGDPNELMKLMETVIDNSNNNSSENNQVDNDNKEAPLLDEDEMKNDILKMLTQLSGDEDSNEIKSDFTNLLDQLGKIETQMNDKNSNNNNNNSNNNDNKPKTPNNLKDSISEVLDSLSEVKDMNEAEMPSGLGGLGGMEEVLNMFKSTDMMEMIDSMMQQIMTKEVLYDSMTQIRDNLSTWIDENKNLNIEIENKHYKQLEIVTKICEMYENGEDELNSEEMQVVANLMVEWQQLGALPPSVIENLAPGVEIDDEGNVKMPDGDPMQQMMSFLNASDNPEKLGQNCPVM
eukprot:TRINITY_DN1036_c4_g1_i1.p1 TRINITY_DN1036_c4_g1~~TRINITY_DN1036_c4_g1_i1.p1  ORF type:complete len:362 (+),score=142.05 TRINITY_DN1036_c4_g1_i1:165-1250(+)